MALDSNIGSAHTQLRQGHAKRDQDMMRPRESGDAPPTAQAALATATHATEASTPADVQVPRGMRLAAAMRKKRGAFDDEEQRPTHEAEGQQTDTTEAPPAQSRGVEPGASAQAGGASAGEIAAGETAAGGGGAISSSSSNLMGLIADLPTAAKWGLGLVALDGVALAAGWFDDDKGTKAPAAPVINAVATDNMVNAAEKAVGVTVAGTAVAGATVTVSWGTTSKTASVDGSGVWSVSFASGEIPADGASEISATATSAAGKESAAATRAVTIDATAPAAPSISVVATDNTVNAAEKAAGVMVSGTAEAGATVSVSWGTSSKSTTASASGAWSVSFIGGEVPADGSTTISATARDAAGNVSTAGTRTVTADTVAPAAPTIAAVATDDVVDGGEKLAGVAVSGTAEAGATVEVSWGATTKTATADASGAWSTSFVSSEIPADGASTVSATARDAAANVSAAATRPVTVASAGQVSGTLSAGPVLAGVLIEAYQADGTPLGATVSDANGAFLIYTGAYTGLVLLRAVDVNGAAADYRDEASSSDLDLEVELRAVANTAGGAMTVNITPLTELAVRKMSTALASAGATDLSGVSAADAGNANAAVAKLFLGERTSSLPTLTPTLIVDAAGADISAGANAYGKVLGLLSAIDGSAGLAGGIGMEATLTYLASRLSSTAVALGANASWSDVASHADIRGAGQLFDQAKTALIGIRPNWDFTAVLRALGLLFDAVGPEFSSATSASVAENATTDTVVYQAAASDASGVLGYALTTGVADNALFDIDVASGAVRFRAPPDFEAPVDADQNNDYVIQVEARDVDGNTTTHSVTISVTNANEAPISPANIAAQTAVVDTAFSYNLAALFSDPDAGDALSFSASALPAGFSLSSAGILSGTASGTFAATSVTVTATDAAGLSASADFQLSAVSAPVLSSELSGVSNLSVLSNIVLRATESVMLATSGTYTISIVNDGGAGLRGESRVHTQTITITDGVVSGNGAVTTSGNLIVINPQYDLDFANNYHIEVSAGAFVGVTSGQSSLAVGAGSIAFSTVTPGAGQLASAVASQAMNTDTGALVASHKWVDVEGNGNTAGATAVNYGNLSNGSYALVAVDYDTNGYVSSTNAGIRLHDFWISVTGFGANDLFYIDNQDNSLAAFVADSNYAFNHTGSAPSTLAFGTVAGSTSSQSFLDITAQGSTAGFDDHAALLTYLQTLDSSVTGVVLGG